MPPAVGHVNKFWGRDRGGIEAVLHALVQDQSRRGYGVAVLACRPWRSPARPFPSGVAGRELAAPVLASMPVRWDFTAALARLQAQSDLLHFHLPFPLAEAAALRLQKRIPWVVSFHAEVVGRAGWVQRAQRAVSRRFLERADAIVVSAPASSHSEGLRPFPERVHIIPFGFDWTAYAPRPRPVRDLPILIFIGRLVAYKGLDVLLQALADVPARLQIIGEGRERPRLQRLAERLRLNGRVQFLGHLPDAELPNRLAAADIFVLPSCSPAETFGVAQLEAMAAGLPVVNTTLATGTDWVSLDGVTGLTVTPNDHAQLSAALRRLIDDRQFRLACGRRARQRAHELFSIERRGAELSALYTELLTGVARPRRSKLEVFPLRA